MSVDQKLVHTKLKLKIEKLISAYELLKEENDNLLEQKASLNSLLKEKEQVLSALEKKYNQQQLAKAVMASSENVHDAKLKVSRIVREIDQCIALLNR
jgi:hypothetical protein